MGTVESTIRQKLQEAFAPEKLEVRNVSHHHAGHAGSPGTGESHFEVELTSASFEGMSKVARQRAVYQTLREEMAGPVHALALKTFSPGE
ncbi:BolA family transcriptional regulator [bacterium]|nr:BolA family transcriptional regulator [bacterium]